MNDTVICAFIGIIGSLLGFGFSFLIEFWRSKKEKERITLEMKINIYADAIRCMSICSKIAMYNHSTNPTDIEYVKNLTIEEGKLYNSFYPIFTIVAPKEKIEKYNGLRARVCSGQLSQEEVYRHVVEILDYNIND